MRPGAAEAMLLSEVESSMLSANPVPRAMAKLLNDVDLHVVVVPGVSDLLSMVLVAADAEDDPAPSKPGGGGVREVKLG